MHKYTLTYKGYYNLLLELVNLHKEFMSTLGKIESNEITVEILDLENELELIQLRQDEIYAIVKKSVLIENKIVDEKIKAFDLIQKCYNQNLMNEDLGLNVENIMEVSNEIIIEIMNRNK